MDTWANGSMKRCLSRRHGDPEKTDKGKTRFPKKPFLFLVLSMAVGLGGCSKEPRGDGRTPPATFSIFYTCDTEGHIEPCGCASGMAGGISRRQTYLQQALPKDFLLVDAGDVTAGARAWEKLEFEYILKGYRQMGYHAVNLGHKELSLGREGLQEMTAHFDGFVSANVVGAEGEPVCKPYVVRELSNGYRCGIIGIVDDLIDPDAIGAGLQVTDPAEALAKYLPELRDQADCLVLLAFTDEPRMRALAQQFFEIDVIVGGRVQKANVDPIRENRSAIVFNTDKGKAVGRLDVFPHKTEAWTFQNGYHTLEESMVRDTEMAALVEAFKHQLGLQDFRPVKDDVEGLSSITATRSKHANRYAGPATCKACHPEAYATWAHSKHAHALDTLEQKGHQHNPRCLKCHTVGYMASDGYVNQRLTAPLAHVSCESCHGRGHHHNQLMAQEKVEMKRVIMKLTQCVTCHDPENSPHFDADEFWQKIAHGQP